MRSSPIQVGSGFYRKIAAGNNSTMAVDPYGTLSAWGENLYGQAGTNSITNNSWIQLSNGDAHSLALRSDGTLYAWGLNTSGQLGVGNTVARQSPTQVPGSWTQISAGASHTIAIRIDGTVYGWGLNTSGQVGDVTVISRSAPVQIPVAGPSSNYSNFFDGTGDYLSIDPNSAFDLSTSDFTVECWVYLDGSNNSRGFFAAGNSSRSGIGYQISTSGILQVIYGNGTTCTFVTGTNVLQLNTWIHVATSRVGSNARVYINGTLEITVTSSNFGAGSYSCFVGIGYGISGGNLTLGAPILGYISNFRLIKGTALYTTGFYPSTGRLTTTSQGATASQVSLLTAQSSNIVDNSTNAFVINVFGPATVSSSNPYGPYYSGSFTTTGQSLRVASNSAFDFSTGNFTIECWFYSTTVGTQVLIDRWNFGVTIFLLRLVGTQLQGWINTSGGNSNLGGGTVAANTWNHAAFVRNGSIFNLYLNGVSVGIPINTALAISTGTSVVSIGGNASETIVGYMSDVRIVKGTAVYTGNFTPPGNILRTTQSAMTNIVALTGTETSLLTLQNATIIDNSVNAFTITNNGSVSITTSYAPFIGSATEFLIANKIAAGNNFTLAIRNDNTLYSWGLNTSYQLGTGSTILNNVPNQIGISSWLQISAGGTHALAIDINNLLYGWGTQTSGQLGLGDTALRSQPTQIGASSWSQISAGYSHSIAVTSDNQLFTWGNNTNGQLGFNMSFISIGAGSSATSIVRSDGTLWTWGLGSSGQLGDGTTLSRSSPVQIGLLNTWSKITSPSFTNYAIDNTGKLYAWGENSSGSVGDDTFINRSSPVQVGSSSWTMIAGSIGGVAGQQTAYAIRSDGALFAWGNNSYGQGPKTGNVPNTSPIQIGNSSYSVVSAGLQFALAITSDGKLYGWGRNDAGQLGITATTFSWATINSSGLHTLAIRSDGLLFAWGFNTQGQLGLGDTVARSSPVLVANGSYTQISAGLTNSYAIRSDGSLWSWGSNTKGQLGDLTASTIGRSSPAQVGTDSWSLLSASQTLNYVLATRSDNTLYSWGDNTTSATGNYTLPSINNNVSSPVQVSGAGSWTQISAGGGHSLAINSDNKLYGWGLNNIGQTANNGSTFSWTQIASGTQHSLAIRSDGLLFAWGNNILGQLGNLDGGSGNNRSSPIQIGTSSWSQVSAADTFSLAIRNDSTLWAWGGNGSGFLGLNDTVNRSSPTQIGTATDWASVYTGQSNSFAIKSDSSLYAWGLNTSGMLGLGDTVNRSSPVQVATPLVSWSQVASGISFSGGIDTLGRLYTWGFNTQGQLGGAGNGVTTGNTISRSSPSQVGASSWSAVAAGQNAMIGIRNTGGIFTWGSNTLGELGNGSTITTTNRSSPVQVGTSSWSAVSARRGTVVALTTAGSLWSWGFNTQGQLGDNSTVAKSSMVAVAGGGTYTKISTGWKSLALTATTFNIVTWGRNDSGDLGIDNVANRSNPVQIGTNISTVINAPTIIGASSWTSVSAGASHSMAIRTDSGLFAWGFNTQGQLGDSTTVSRSSPVQVGTSSWTTVSAGTGHTMALRYLDGGLFTWGLGNPGQLGSGATASRSSPVQVGTSSWTTINSGASTGVAIDITNNIYAWGLGTSGQIGDNTIVTKSVPTKVGTFQSTIEYSPVQVGSSSWSQVSAGASHAVGIEIDNTVFAWGLNTSGQLGDNTVVSRSSPVQVGAVTNSLTNANAYSLSFNGTSQSLSISSNSAFTMNTGDFTFETYLYNSKVSWAYVPIFGNSVSGQSRIYTDAAGLLHLYNNDASVNIATIGTLASLGMSLNTWIHIAVVRISGVLKFYFNGVSAPLTFTTGTGAESVDFINSTIGYVGTGPGSGSAYLKGYLSNLRLVKGTGVYTGNFTPSTIPLTAISGTSLLTAQNTNIVDNSTNAFTVTNNNSVSYSLNTPFTSAIEAGGLFVTQVSAGATHSVAIDSSSKLYGWGLNSSGQLGLSNIINRSAPTQIGLANNYNAISAGVDYTIALDNIGTLYAWGLGTTGQLGLSDAVTRSSSVQVASISIPNTSSPTQVGSNSYILVNAGNNISTAISSDSKLFVWGLGTTGQLGTGVTFSRSSPVQISTNSYNLVNAGGTHTTFVTNYSPQLILSTGLNTSGQLGQSSIISRSSPTQVAASATAFNTPVTVSTGDYSSYYVSSPTQVGTSSWTQVSAGGTHTLGVKYDNTLWAWGYNANGQLGGSNTINRSSPVQVGTSSWSQVSAGDSHNTIAKSDGTINTFGLNSFGQLGDGT